MHVMGGRAGAKPMIHAGSARHAPADRRNVLMSAFMRGPVILPALLLLQACSVNVDADAHPCSPALADALQPYDMNLREMRNVHWLADTTGSRSDGVFLQGYRFYGAPPACGSGRIAVQFGPKCQVEDMDTTWGCNVPGID